LGFSHALHNAPDRTGASGGRAISSIRDLATFRRFVSLVAGRCGQMLNKTDLAAPLGISVPTVTEWLGILETTGEIILVPPFHENFGKRLITSPKVYLVDSETALRRSSFYGPVFEGFVASEIVKLQSGFGHRAPGAWASRFSGPLGVADLPNLLRSAKTTKRRT